MTPERLIENMQLVRLSDNADINGAGITGDYVDFSKFHNAIIVCMYGDGTAGNDLDYTLYEAKDNAGTDAQALAALETGRIYRKIAADFTAEQLVANVSKITQGTAASTYTPTDNGEATGYDCFELVARDLSEGFTHIRMDVADPGAAKITQLFALMYNPRDSRVAASMPSAIG